jgi:hypothetical protein
MAMTIYRFRSMAALLVKHKELEKQEIFLADSENLNDPMEGYEDVFWLGDSILWRNLLRHYLLCLLLLIIDSSVFSEAEWDSVTIPVMLTPRELPSTQMIAAFEHAEDIFLQDAAVGAVLQHLSRIETPLRREGMFVYLSWIHSVAWLASIRALVEKGLWKGAVEFTELETSLRPVAVAFENIETAAGSPPNWSTSDSMFEATRLMIKQSAIIKKYGMVGTKNFHRIASVTVDFTENYLDAVVRKLIHPKWYTACFSADPTNASMWATYADEHRGAVLKFDAQLSDGRPALTVDAPVGTGSSRADPRVKIFRGERTLPLYQVGYETGAPEMDFFRFLGQLPISKAQWWQHDANGLRSERLTDELGHEEWRKTLWKLFTAAATTKLPDWRHEQEYRFVLSDHGSGALAMDRKLRYPLSSLKGIVFGIASKAEQQFEIMKMIEQKCRAEGRRDFEFHQARYSRRTRKIEIDAMKLLQFG